MWPNAIDTSRPLNPSLALEKRATSANDIAAPEPAYTSKFNFLPLTALCLQITLMPAEHRVDFMLQNLPQYLLLFSASAAVFLAGFK